MKSLENEITLNELKWDTSFFGVTCAQIILHKPLTLKKWSILKSKLKEYQFISIMNQNSNPTNAQIIGKNTSAFVADINIQFQKELKQLAVKPSDITIYKALEKNDRIIELANFHYSKFIEDPQFAKRGGGQVYRQWVISSFNKEDKFYALSKNLKGVINGFLLFSYKGNSCVIELIAVSPENTKSGIGIKLFQAVEYEASKRGFKKIRVGTQIRNLAAINFYHRVGCKQIGCSQVYHLWNL